MKVRYITLIVCFCYIAFAQAAQAEIVYSDSTDKAPANWFNLDAQTSKIQGVSTEKTYEILKDKPATKVVVAVIDSGVDPEHEDLADKLWTNEDEQAGNGIDDDNNGYIDDVHGWNFIGGADGTNVSNDTYELTREYVRLQKKYGDQVPEDLSKEEEAYYEKIKRSYEAKVAEMQQERAAFQYFAESYHRSNQLLTAYLGVEEVTADSLAQLNSPDEVVMMAKGFMEYALEKGFNEEELQEAEEYFSSALDYGYNLEFNSRTVVGDHYNDLSERYYGNSDVKGPDARHGTHVAGIIAANRNNNLGIKGIADQVEIMIVRAVPDGDERDKDVANAIYYAVDNGAKIINMSFGKSYSPQKKAVDAAVQYAQEKGVLIIHAAGNSGENIDKNDNFPNRSFADSKKSADNWIEVGASSWKGEGDFVASFSNYGKRSVDVFAPGVDLYSTTPDQSYESLSGTSMAAPVVSGVAALLMSYYPDLSVEQVKEILLKSAVKLNKLKVNSPGDALKQVKFSSLSRTGGVVNALEAVKLAESY